MKPKLPYRLRKEQILGFSLLACMVIILQLGWWYYRSLQTPQLPPIEFQTNENTTKPPLMLMEFNPNDLDQSQWQALGFTERQAATILKYKAMIGGAFLSKEQFKKCYPIQPRYDELAPYILLPEHHTKNKKTSHSTPPSFNRNLNIRQAFNPNHYTAKDWVAIGFSEKQAEAIIKYRQFLGGSFESKEQLKSCFVISAERYEQMRPFLQLPDKINIPKPNLSSEKPKIQYSYFDPNDLDEQGWQSLGFTEKQAQSILNYKNKILRGRFKTLEEVQKSYVIASKFEELKPWIKFSTPSNEENLTSHQVSKTEPITVNFSELSLNHITQKQLVAFGFSEKVAGSLVAYRKSLGGFMNKNQVFEVYNIDRDLAEKLVATLQLDNTNVARYTLVDAPESWLKTHPYFKYSADKIIFYRISYPDDKKIWKFIKVKPEVEAKMKLYLK